MDEPQAITVTLVPLPDERPVAVRVRLALKHLLRAQRLRCVDISGVAPGEGRDEEDREEDIAP